MTNQLTTNADALRLFFTEDVYLVKNEAEMALDPIAAQKSDQPISEVKTAINVEEITALNVPINEEKVKEPKKAWNFEYLGKNQKNILILVNDTVNKVSSAQGNLLLRKLVDAIGLANSDFALVNHAHYSESRFDDLNEFFNCQLLLAFGVDAEVLGLSDFALHQIHNLGDIKLIFTTNLHDLDSDQTSKKILWSTLKQLK
jgi:hypothetical protein